MANTEEQNTEKLNIEYYANLLKNTHNLILHGAPGTGKTYLAKQIAKKMGCTDNEIGFVQFHPSYDYTDFVEGLRPTKRSNKIENENENNENHSPANNENSQIGFELKDGIFKKFCSNAIGNIQEYDIPKKTEETSNNYLEDLFLQYCNYITEQLKKSQDGQINFSNDMKIQKVTKNGIGIATAPKKTVQYLTSEIFYRDYLDFKNGKIKSKNDIRPSQKSKKDSHGNADYYFSLYKHIQDFEKSKNYNPNKQKQFSFGGYDFKNSENYKPKKSFVFIIDEINRGEISKIFGELFFSIDPGYRGEKGKIKTQYANLQDKANEFDKFLGIENKDNYGHFFIPENVYIIGTMNDIDRSVDSMDFAMRRRFTFKEVTAKDSQSILDSDEAWGKDENDKSLKPDADTLTKIKNRMDNLNDKIWHKPKENEPENEKSIEGLSSAYHIGGAYFLKLKELGNDFDKLWEYHLEGLLREYLRGMDDESGKLNKLKAAYGYKEN